LLQDFYINFSKYFDDQPYNFFKIYDWLNNTNILEIFNNNIILYELYLSQHLEYLDWWNNNIGIRDLYYNIIKKYV